MIEILVLQNPKVLVNKQEMMFPYKKVEALLYYMAVENPATRDLIATLLWELITSPTRQNLE